MRYLAYLRIVNPILITLLLLIPLPPHSEELPEDDPYKVDEQTIPPIGLREVKKEEEATLETELSKVIKLADGLKYSQAEEELKSLIDKYGEKAVIYYDLGVITEYGDEGRYTGDLNKAISYYLKCIEIENQFFPAYYNLGVLYQHLGYNESAESQYRKALSIREDARIYHNLGIIAYNKADYENAIDYFLTALKLSEENLITLRCLGLCYEKVTDTANAIKTWKYLYQKETDPVWVKYARKKLEDIRGY
ncbi:MAG TPA: tetratricopeptide repeat protein [Firmicutes bacterium]|nr:MAG: hypothetical protein DRH49_05345 [Candidatus Coatesbacteria bacterium]HDM42759.1 tetratricopeptide repeat protein [Bacillota bacterium]